MSHSSVRETLQPMERLLDQLVSLAPRAALVLGVLLAGIVVSALARRVMRWGVARSGLETLAERVGVAKVLYGIGYRHGLAPLLGQVAWFAGLLFTVAAVAEVLGLPAVARGTGVIMAFLPRALAAGGVLLGGVLLARFLKGLVERFGGERDDVESPRFVGLLTYYTVVTVAAIMAVHQVGLDTGLVDAIVKISLAAAVASLGVAFALSSRQAFQNLIARYYFERIARPGDRLQMGDSEGLLVRYTALAAIVRTDRGERVIPCKLLFDQPVDVERINPAKRAG